MTPIETINFFFGSNKGNHKIFIFDFDTTLTTHDIYPYHKIDINIFRKNVIANFEKFIKQNKHVIILSYNMKKTIVKALSVLLSSDALKKLVIVTPEIYGLTYDDIKDHKLNMKKVYIDGLIKLHSVDPSCIVFYDNDLANVTHTGTLGIKSVLVRTDADLNVFM